MFLKAVFVLLVAVGLAYWSCPWLDQYIVDMADIERLKVTVSEASIWKIFQSRSSNVSTSTSAPNLVNIQTLIEALDEMIKTPEHCLNVEKVKEINDKSGTGIKRQFKNIAVGINANVDFILPGVQLLQELNIKPGSPIDHSQIFTLDQLQQAFHYYFRRGAAAERPFMNENLYKEIIAKKVKKSQEFIGGNAALIAWNVMTQYPDVKVTLVAPVGPKLKELLTPKINVPEFSQFDEDEVHLIMEYEKDQVWGPSKSPVANRFITSNDKSNSNAVVIDLFFNIIEEGKFDLIVLSGLHLLESQPQIQWQSRLTLLSRRLTSVPSWRPVHLELASMTNVNLVLNIADKVLTQISSLGLNEQELSLLSQVGKGPHQSLKTDGKLDIRKVGDTVHWVLMKYGKKTKSASRLTRVHFHTLSFHMTAVRGRWSNQESSTGAGARMAGLKACSAKKLDPVSFDLKIDLKFKLHSKAPMTSFDSSKPIITWQSDDDISMVFSPVLVCKKPVKTVGLGDAISATGLLYSTFTS